MATLKDFFNGSEVELQDFVLKHNIVRLIETGTGLGDSVDFVRRSIMNIYSIEIIPEIAKKAKERFKLDRSIDILNMDSISGLKKIVDGSDGNNLYFLDAHFPGADFKYASYDSEKDKDKRIPLEREVETIIKLRKKAIKHDVIICDDLRIYEDGPYGDGNWPLRDQLGGSSIKFIYDAFGNTHFIEKDFRFQGFLVITPVV